VFNEVIGLFCVQRGDRSLFILLIVVGGIVDHHCLNFLFIKLENKKLHTSVEQPRKCHIFTIDLCGYFWLLTYIHLTIHCTSFKINPLTLPNNPSVWMTNGKLIYVYMYCFSKYKPYFVREHILVFSLGNISFIQHHAFPVQHYAAVTIETSMPLSNLWNYNIISPYK